MQSTEGNRKRRFELLPPDVLEVIVEVFEGGAVKYGDFNWKEVVSDLDGVGNYLGAAYRHLNKIHQGQWVDEESGLPHAAHLAATAMILTWAALHWCDESHIAELRKHEDEKYKVRPAQKETVEHSEHYNRTP